MWLKAVFLLLVRLTTGLESDGLSKCMWRKEKSEVRKERARLLWESAKDLLSNSGWRENSWSKSRGKWCVVHLYVIEGDAELGCPEGWEQNPGRCCWDFALVLGSGSPCSLLTEVKFFCFPLQLSVTWPLHSKPRTQYCKSVNSLIEKVLLLWSE